MRADQLVESLGTAVVFSKAYKPVDVGIGTDIDLLAVRGDSLRGLRGIDCVSEILKNATTAMDSV